MQVMHGALIATTHCLTTIASVYALLVLQLLLEARPAEAGTSAAVRAASSSSRRTTPHHAAPRTSPRAAAPPPAHAPAPGRPALRIRRQRS